MRLAVAAVLRSIIKVQRITTKVFAVDGLHISCWCMTAYSSVVPVPNPVHVILIFIVGIVYAFLLIVFVVG